MIRLLFIVFLTVASQNSLANAFEFAGLSRATTLQDIAKRYPNSSVSGAYVYVSPKDTHDHIFGIELFGPKLSTRLRINFAGPDRKYPPCQVYVDSIAARYGSPSQVREFSEEASWNRYFVWQLKGETVQLQCFRFGGAAKYSAEAIAVFPK